jgi:plastocyanin
MSGWRNFRLAAAIALAATVAGVLGATAQQASAGAGCFKAQAPREATRVAVAMKGFCFAPIVLRVDPGQSVTWTNGDTLGHQVVGAGSEWGPVGEVLEGRTFTYRFEKPGIYPYSCLLHWGMTGVVVVGDVGVAAQGDSPAAKAAVVAPAQPPGGAAVAIAIDKPADEGANTVLYAGLGAGAGLLAAGLPLGWLALRRRR